MRRLLQTAGAIIGLGCTVAPAALASGSIPWSNNLNAALANARRTHKMVLVDFYTSWCGYCKRLDAEAYQDPGVIHQLANAIPVKLDAEHEGLDAARRYGVTGFPTILFLDENGKVESRLGGYLPTPNFSQFVARAFTDHAEFPALLARHHANPADANTSARILTHYVQHQDTEQAAAILKDMVAADPRNHSHKICTGYAQIAGIYAQQKQYVSAISYFKRALGPGATPSDQALSHLGIALCLLPSGHTSQAIPELKAAAAVPGAPARLRQYSESALQQLQGAAR
jgi:thioredoxin-related protein